MPDIQTLRLILEPSDELQKLRAEVHTLQEQVLEMERAKSRAEYMMMCNSSLYLELLDWAKSKGYKVPRRMQNVFGTEYMPDPTAAP